MDTFLQTFCRSVAELAAAISKKWVWFSQVSAIQNSVLTCCLYESSFKPVNLAKVKRNFIFMDIDSHSEKKPHKRLYVVLQMFEKLIS